MARRVHDLMHRKGSFSKLVMIVESDYERRTQPPSDDYIFCEDVGNESGTMIMEMIYNLSILCLLFGNLMQYIGPCSIMESKMDSGIRRDVSTVKGHVP